MHGQAVDIKSLLWLYRCYGEGGNSDAKNAERGCVSAGRRGRAAIQNPCGRGIGHQKLGRSIQDYGGGLDYRHLRNNLSQNGETFRRDAIRLARLRHQQRTYGLNTWVIHSRVIVSHSGHGVRRLTAVALTFRSGVAFTHNCAEPGRSNNPGQQDSQENYRSCGFSGHFGKLYLRLYEMRKLVQGLLLSR